MLSIRDYVKSFLIAVKLFSLCNIYHNSSGSDSESNFIKGRERNRKAIEIDTVRCRDETRVVVAD